MKDNQIIGTLNSYDIALYFVNEEHIAREKAFDIEKRIFSRLYGSGKPINKLNKLCLSKLIEELKTSSENDNNTYSKYYKTLTKFRKARNVLMHPSEKNLLLASKIIDETYEILDEVI